MLKKIIIPLVLLLSLVITANASHIMGGEVKYEYLGSNGPAGTPFRYRLTFNIYNYCGQGSQFPTGEKDMDFAVYRADDNSLIINGTLTTSSCANITPPMPPGCVITDFQNICIRLCQFTTIVNLPLVLDGYHVSYQNCCRNDQITNLQLGGGGGGTTDGNNYYAFIPNPIYKNNSPVFSSLPTPAFCIGDTVTINNNASDPDGDKLIFEFVTPWGGEFSPPGAWVDPPIECIYNAGYNMTQPFGATGYANINPATGISEYYSPNGGLYVVAINVKEYRTINGVETLIGTVRRDMQLLVSGNCPVNVGPTVATLNTSNAVISTSSSVVFDIESGQQLCFKTRGTDASDSVFVSAVGNILDGSNGYTGPLATFTTTKGKPTSTSNFCWQTNCNVVGTFFVNATIADKGCPPKSESVTYQINVNKFKAPTSISGPATLCYSATAGNSVYTAVTPKTTSTYKWVVTGNGTIVGSSTNPSVTIKWNSPGAYSVKFIETSQYGCKDSISTVINVQNGAQVSGGADVNICAGTPATLDATSSSFVSYLWLPTNQTSGSITVSPTTTTSYIVRGTDATTGCFSYDTVNVNVVNIDANAGADKTICSGSQTSIGTSTSGATFVWSPSTYISGSATGATALTVKYNNTSASDTTITYYLQTTSTFLGCVDKDTVKVTFKRAPIVNAGTDGAICSGDTIQIGSSADAGHSYSWTQPSGGGLTATNISNPMVIGVNTGTTPIINSYIVTASVSGCSKKDTVNITVYPSLKNLRQDTTQSICFGTTLQMGNSGDNSQTYVWTPTVGLSNGSIPNPVLNYTHNPSADTTINFVATISNAFGCTKQVKQTVTIKPAPTANAGADASICSGDTTTIGSAGETNVTYSWVSNVGLLAPTSSLTQSTLTNTTTAPVIRTYIVTANLNGCLDKDTVKVQVYPSLKNVNAGADKEICFGETYQLGTAADASQTYIWTPTTGLSNPNSSNPIFNYTHNPTVDTTIVFTVTVANAFGCDKTDQVTVKVKQAPIAGAGSDVSICSGDTSTIGTAAETNVTYSWASTTGLISPTSSITNVTLTNTTTSPVNTPFIVTATLNGCIDRDTVTVQTYPSLKNVNAGADQVLCFGNTVSLGNAGDASQTYVWTPTIGLVNSNTSNPTFNYTHNPTVDTTITYTVTVANAFGCDVTDQVTVILKQSPIAGAGANVSICSGDTTTIGTAAETNVTYSWASTTGLLSPTASITDVTLTNTTTAPVNTTFVVTATLNGCIDRDTVTVQTYPSLKNVDAGADQVLCFGNTVSLGNAGDASQTYVWTPTIGLVNPNTPNPTFNYTHNPTVDTIITYTVTVANAFGCDVTDVVTVTLKQTPVANAGADVDFCSDDVVTIGSADAGATYTWNTTTGIASPNASSTTITLTNTTTSPVITDYYLTADINGCIDVDTINVKVYPAPTAAAMTGAPVVCPGINGIQYGFTTYNANSTYQWFINGGTITSTVNDTANVNWGAPNASAFISVFEITEYNCPSDTVKLNVRINTKLEPSTPAGATPVCLNEAANLIYNTNLTNGSTYTWNIDGGVINSGNGTNQINTSWSGVGTGKLWVIESVTADSVCTGQSDTLYVEIKASPMADAGADVSICSGDTASLGAATIAGQTYAWTNTSLLNSGTIAGPVTTDINSGTSPVINQFVLLTGLANGCEARDTVNVEVYPSLKNVNAGTDQTICSYDTITLGTTSSAGQTYNWNMLTGISDSTIADPVFTVTNIGGTNTVYTYIVQVTNAFNCSKTDTVAVTVKSAPVPNAGNDISICSGASGTIGSANNSQYTYNWLNTNGLSSGTVSDPTVTLVNTNNTTDSAMYVVDVNLNGCFDKDTVKVFIYPSLKAIEAGLDTALCAGQTVVLGPSQTISNQQYTWIPANNLSSATVANPVLDSTNTGTSNIVLQYVLSVDNGFNCKANDTVTVVLKPQLRPLSVAGTMELCQYTNSQLYYVNGLNGSTYTWTLDGTAITTSNDSIVLDWNTPGTYTLNVSELNQKCAGNAYDTLITVNPKPATPSITGEASICPQKATGFIYYATGLSGSNYQWNITGGTITSVGAGTDTIYVNWNNELVKSLQVTETSNKNCVSDAGVQPIIWDAANVNMLVVSNQNEEEKNVNLAWRLNDIENYPNNVDLYRREILPTLGTWVKVATLPKTDTSYTDLGLSTDANSFEYKIVGINSCGDSLITLLHNNILLKGTGDEATESTTIDWNEYKNWSNSVKEYQVWRKLDDAAYELYQTVDKNTLSQSYTNANDGFTQCYKIFAIEEQGNNRLSISNEICLQFANPLMIPNVFTPNGDGTNDTWIIENIHLYKKCVINIYNRWGNEVKQLEAYKNDWNGDGLSEGVYYFILDLNNGQEPVKGWLQILK